MLWTEKSVLSTTPPRRTNFDKQEIVTPIDVGKPHLATAGLHRRAEARWTAEEIRKAENAVVLNTLPELIQYVRTFLDLGLLLVS